MSFGNIIISALVFVAIVMIHEFGHFIVAKLSGIRVEEFAIGMGPKIAGKKKGETLYSLRAIPIGGYCKLTGEDEASSDIKAFNNKPLLTRMAVIFCGPLMNFILAVLIFSLIISQSTTINEVIVNKPAYDAGIQKGDRIVEINGKKVEDWDSIKKAISSNPNIPINITLQRNNEIKNVIVTPIVENETDGAVIGITPTLKISGLSIKNGLSTTIEVSKAMLDFLVKLFTGRASTDEVSGPIGIVVFINEAAKVGFLYLLNLTAFLSLNLGIVNLLPIPALDGGRLLFLFIELIRRKPIDIEKEGFINFIGFVALMVIAVIIAYKDLIKFNILNFFR
ncbi:RIP metalloprotease RseP [Lutispora thermophila]|uniref:Zinc metalloprotease n=1 Tax=Lutispora thermophila DSM 19022 TaxID=1122184 RepID=A0A1M6I4F7_9FIRM|nr:RIP metalloprotease RseP [Lutispora thermophila]SHJ29346.1 regulator of sigma E protease [Lutispora thermophila DSM 19022]